MLDTERIRSLREKLGLTQSQAALRAGMKSKQNWYAVESVEAGGKGITLTTLNAVAKALECNAKDLLK